MRGAVAARGTMSEPPLAAGQWACSRCTFINDGTYQLCAMCGSEADVPSVMPGMSDSIFANDGSSVTGGDSDGDDAPIGDVSKLTEMEGVQLLFDGVKTQLDVEKYILFQVGWLWCCWRGRLGLGTHGRWPLSCIVSVPAATACSRCMPVCPAARRPPCVASVRTRLLRADIRYPAGAARVGDQPSACCIAWC